jgi:hypothetical protein
MRTTPIPCGSLPSTAALTRDGARKASERVIVTWRLLQFSRAARSGKARWGKTLAVFNFIQTPSGHKAQASTVTRPLSQGDRTSFNS